MCGPIMPDRVTLKEDIFNRRFSLSYCFSEPHADS